MDGIGCIILGFNGSQMYRGDVGNEMKGLSFSGKAICLLCSFFFLFFFFTFSPMLSFPCLDATCFFFFFPPCEPYLNVWFAVKKKSLFKYGALFYLL